MAKRNAAAELNHDNWDAVDDDKEEAGTFVPLSKEQLQNRVIRKARRSNNANTSTNSSSSVSSPFAQFSGFSSSTAASPFRKTDTNPLLARDPQTSNGKPSENVDNTPFGNSDDAKQLSSSAAVTQPKTARNIEYYRQLQSLNEGVLKWMQLHLVKNACCDFSPVFNDYKKHLDTLNVTYPVQKKEGASLLSQDSAFKQPSNMFANNKGNNSRGSPIYKSATNEDDSEYGAHFKSNTTNTQTVSCGIRTPTSTSSGSALGPTSSFKEDGNQDKSPEAKNTAQFSSGFFSKANQANSDSKPFSFSANTAAENSIQSPGFFGKAYQPANDKPFSFASAVSANSASGDNTDQGEEYVPPKNEFVTVSEDSFYSKRCRLFYKKGEGFAEKGVGTLHLKSLEGRTQLLIRADTSLGNILLNIMLSASLPISRTGKNNVLLVCIPNPPLDAKNPDSKEAIPILIRVKTAEDADELLEKLNQSKS